MSAANYYLNVYDLAGDLRAVVTDFTSLSYTRRVNAAGMLTMTLRGDHPLPAAIQDKWQVEVWRKPAEGTFGRDFVGMYRMGEYYHGDNGPKAVLTCPGLMSMLGWRIVAWYANTANRSAFTAQPAETIMKTLVSYNAGSGATTGNGRLRTGTIAGLTVESDGGGGNSLDWYCAYENLLETLQKLAPIAGGDFDVVKTAADAWQFRFYSGQLGTDRTASVYFGVGLGNMANPQYKEIRIEEKTAAIVGGQGEDNSRAIVVRSGPDYSAANDIEMFEAAPDVGSEDGLEARGDAALDEQRAERSLAFDVLQTPATTYGVHYSLGDRVSAINPFGGETLAVKVDEVTITLDEDGAERIDIRVKG